MPETQKTRHHTSSSSSSSPRSSKPPTRVDVRPEFTRPRYTDVLPSRESTFDFDPRSPMPAGAASRHRESEASASILRERREPQARREEELRGIADAREREEEGGGVGADSPPTPGIPAIDLITHLINQAEQFIVPSGLQITLPFRFKHPQPDDVIPYQIVAADGTVKELRDGEKIVLARREGGSERAVKGKEIVRGDRSDGGRAGR